MLYEKILTTLEEKATNEMEMATQASKERKTQAQTT